MGLIWAKRFDARDDVLVLDGTTMSDTTAAAAASSKQHTDVVLAVAGTQIMASIWSVIAGLAHVLTSLSTPRTTMLLAMDLLQELVNQARVGVVGDVSLEHDARHLPSLRTVLVQMPDSVLDRLVDCLYVPRQGPDAWDATTNTRTQPGYDPNVDFELRDHALDVLVPLMELDSPRLAMKLGRRRDIYQAVIPILTSRVGKSEATLTATHLLRELSKAPENSMALEQCQERLVELASRDARVAHLVWNHIYVKTSENEDNEAAAAATGSDGSVVEP